jgi:hypothetical protein
MAAPPQHVLVLVLKRINQDERLKSCALVSTAWAEAAAMATDAVNCCTGNLADLAIFKPWLDHHGLHVTSLSWAFSGRDEYGKQVLSTLPCRNLQQLSLFDWTDTNPPSCRHPQGSLTWICMSTLSTSVWTPRSSRTTAAT